MRRAWIALVLAACGPTVPPATHPDPSVPRLLPPALIDPDTRGAPYLTSVALQLQPGWQQFLEDCRIRLPAHHALNRMDLAASAELAVDAHGQIRDVHLVSSGNTDFDRAVQQVLADAAPLPRPPRELWSDDDRVHLRWLFARDRRQAGPATASVIDVELALPDVVERFAREHDLARAARRILRAPPGIERTRVARGLMIAALREALGSSESAVRRAAIEAIAVADVRDLFGTVDALVAASSDVDLRATALVHRFGASETVLDHLRADIKAQAPLAIAETKLLAERHEAAAAAAIIRAELDTGARPEPMTAAGASERAPPSPVALQALAFAPIAELAPQLGIWFRVGDARTRQAVCAALAGYPGTVSWPLLERGVADRDATVRASCIDAAREQRMVDARASTTIARVVKLQADRDRAVRARALAAVARLDRSRLVDASGDASPQVRVAYATALASAQTQAAEAQLRALIDDRDPDVRAAAWAAYSTLPALPQDLHRVAARAAGDLAPQVRRAVISLLADDELLWRIANSDDSTDNRTAALVQLARIRTRDGIGDRLVERLGNAGPASGERVRTALAWLLAR